MVNYSRRLRRVKQFIEENFDDPVELTIALGLSVEDIVNLLPDVLVDNYDKFFDDDDNTEEHTGKTEPDNTRSGEDWEDPETRDY
jgi:hypothetical protein